MKYFSKKPKAPDSVSLASAASEAVLIPRSKASDERSRALEDLRDKSIMPPKI